MTKLEQAARQALGALEVATTPLAKDRQEVLRAITTLREALSGVQALSAAPAVHASVKGAMWFTKKPVTIQAIQWTGENLREVITFTDGPPDTRSHHAGMAWDAYRDLVARDGLKIYTLEGKMLASPGDWIIRGVKGEMYPCKDEIFRLTYEPVGEVVSASCDHATVRWLHQTSSVGGGDPRNSRAWPKVSGVSRDEGHSRALLVFFAAEPTDDEVRAVHDTLAASTTPPAEQQAASSAVLKAIHEANMQLVRTGDDAFMLVPYKVATTEAAAPKAGVTTGAALGGVYAELPAPLLIQYDEIDCEEFGCFAEGQMRDFADRTHALRMEQAALKAAPGDALDEALRERDDAEDFIDALLDEVLGHERPEWSSSYGHADALNDVQERMTALHKPAVDKAWGQFQSAMAAPQQEAQEPCPTCAALARAVMLDQVSFDRKPDCYGIRQITDAEGVEEWEDIRTSPDVAREEANDMMATGRGEIYEVVPLWTTPQPAPHLPERDARLPAERQGLFRKFVVGRVDGSDKPGGKHYGCTYFVLDVDHDPCARPALAAYAAACESTHPTLAADLRTKWGVVPAPQPSPTAPATQQPEGDVVAYLDVGAGGYLDLGAALSEDALQQLPKGRHALVIAGTYGIDGYVAAPQPAPAELERLRERIARMGLDVDRAMRGHVNEQSPLGTQRLAAIAALVKPKPAPPSDDVVKDAARYRWLREGNDAKHGAAWHVAVNLYGCEWDAAIDAALAAQGGK